MTHVRDSNLHAISVFGATAFLPLKANEATKKATIKPATRCEVGGDKTHVEVLLKC